MPKGYRHLTYEERCRIPALKGSGRSNGEIARQLGRDPTTVGRETRRNGGEGGYAHAEAQARANRRRPALFPAQAGKRAGPCTSEWKPGEQCVMPDAAAPLGAYLECVQ